MLFCPLVYAWKQQTNKKEEEAKNKQTNKPKNKKSACNTN